MTSSSMTQLCSKCGASPSTLAAPLHADSGALPDLASLLASNDPPLESEIPLIRGVISDGQAQLDQLEALLAPLIQKRDEIAKRVGQHRAILSSIRRVPTELICEIFALASLSGSSDDEDNVDAPPWYLGQICRAWRQCVLSYPALWSCITVPSSLSLDNNQLPLQTQLHRSAATSLDIHWPNVETDVDPRLLELILPLCTRWRSLHLYVDRADGHDRVLDWLHAVSGHLDRLRTLEADFRMVIPDIFMTAPNLREVILTDEHFIKSLPIRLPWGQITHYRGTYTPNRQLEIVKTAPNLVECVMGFADEFFDPNAQHMVTLPQLRRLSLEYVDFLAYLTAPALEDLLIIDGPQEVSFLLSFIQRSACTLKNLVLMPYIIRSDVIAALRELPNLTYLLLEYLTGDDTVYWMNDMVITGAPSDICPNLTSFVFGYKGGHFILWDVFFAMIRSRFRSTALGTSHLQRLRIFNAGDPQPPPPNAVLAGMNRLCNEGFDVAFLDEQETLRLKRNLL